MMPDFIKRFYNSAPIQALRARQTFVTADTVTITASRNDDEWESKFAAMRHFCEAHCKARFLPSAPMGSDEVSFSFEDATDALFFKLRFG